MSTEAIVFFANDTDPFPHVLLPDPEVPCPACEGLFAPCAHCGGKGKVIACAYTVIAALDPPCSN